MSFAAINFYVEIRQQYPSSDKQIISPLTDRDNHRNIKLYKTNTVNN